MARVLDPRGIAVVYPVAGPVGGVERVVGELLRHESTRRPTTFVGRHLAPSLAQPAIRHLEVVPRWTPPALRPRAFAAAARPVMDGAGVDTVLTCGVECPPGDVLWVHSVHAAWLDRGAPVEVAGRRVPSALRRMLPRHRVLLDLERRYFAEGTPRLVLCTSQQEVDDVEHYHRVDPGLARVVPNGYDQAVFNVGRRDRLRGAARERIGADEDDVVVLLVANEWHRKGLGALIDAVAAVGDRRLRIDLVGRVSPHSFGEQVARRHLGDRFHWHGPASDVETFYAAADVFALPTQYEPFGIVIVEAMAMGLPVVVPALAGAAALVTPDVDGLVLGDPRDVDALSRALTELLDPSVRRRVGAAAPAAVAHLGWDEVLARVDSLAFGPSVVD